MDLVAVLQKLGAIISVDVDRTFRIEGVKELKGYTHTALTDRIEAASWASAALATHGDVFVKGATQPEMMTFLNVFRKIGGEFDITDRGIRFWHPGGDLKPVAIETDVHPGFMTDWQQPLVVALTQANGLSIVPVSSTHLDVYKRQLAHRGELGGRELRVMQALVKEFGVFPRQQDLGRGTGLHREHGADRDRIAQSARALDGGDAHALFALTTVNLRALASAVEQRLQNRAGGGEQAILTCGGGELGETRAQYEAAVLVAHHEAVALQRDRQAVRGLSLIHI